MKQYLEAGEIINTHGILGELKVRSLCNTLDDLLSLKTVYLSGKPIHVISSRPHKGFALMKLDGIDTIEKAKSLKNSFLFLDRADLNLESGAVFLQDILGFSAFDDRIGKLIGTIENTISLPRGDLLVIKGDEEYLIPANPVFIKEIDQEEQIVHIHTIEGMLNEI
ncbi:MAG: ribosome maturation factor RimM [Clostridiales bacterium]|nr:ribosome maturation factor RimM [Clostridiales bacterium]